MSESKVTAGGRNTRNEKSTISATCGGSSTQAVTPNKSRVNLRPNSRRAQSKKQAPSSFGRGPELEGDTRDRPQTAIGELMARIYTHFRTLLGSERSLFFHYLQLTDRPLAHS